jgi:hypothetical protein
MFSYIHDAVSGENFKSRAHYNALLYNYIADSPESEVEGVDGPDTTSPNSNMVLIGNVILSRPDRRINTTKFIHFGQDVGGDHDGTLYLINNTLIAGSPTIGFLRSSAPHSAIIAVNNVFWGSDTIVQPAFANAISGDHDVVQSGATVPPGFTNITTTGDPSFVNPAVRDYYLTGASACRDIGDGSPVYVDGDGVSQSGIPTDEYVRHLRGTSRLAYGALDVGVYEFGTSLPNEPRAPSPPA